MSDIGKQGVLSIGEEAKPPFAIVPDPASVFRVRSERFARLAPGHELEPYLAFLSRLTAAQHDLSARLPPVPRYDEAAVKRALAHGMPPLELGGGEPHPQLDETITGLMDALETVQVPAATRAAMASISAAQPAARLDSAAGALGGEATEDLAQRTLMLAALQVYATRRAAQLSADALQPIGDGICPSCGRPPVASAVVGWPKAHNSRFCFCSLCNTAWNVVRVKCTICSTTGGISYKTIDGQSEAVKAETCEACKAYVKIMYQVHHPELEPVADDVATLGLDLLMRDAGWRRAGVNAFLLGY